jgi:hypothetical protein
MPLDGSTKEGPWNSSEAEGHPEKQVAGTNRENVFVVMPKKFYICYWCSQSHLASFKCTIFIFFQQILLFQAVLHASKQTIATSKSCNVRPRIPSSRQACKKVPWRLQDQGQPLWNIAKRLSKKGNNLHFFRIKLVVNGAMNKSKEWGWLINNRSAASVARCRWELEGRKLCRRRQRQRSTVGYH